MTRLVLFLLLAGCGVTDVTTMAVSEVRDDNCHSDGANCLCPGSPIILDLDGDGIDLTGTNNGVVFELRRGSRWLWSWTAPGSDDAWLALPGDNGRVDGGWELFGDETLRPISGRNNGFAALAMYDEGGDGWITDVDPIWSSLRLWIDLSHDGISQPGELVDLERAGVLGLSVVYSEDRKTVDRYGNEFRYSAPVLASGNVGSIAYDVFLLGLDQPRQLTEASTQSTTTVWECTGTAWSVRWTNQLHACMRSTRPNDIYGRPSGGTALEVEVKAIGPAVTSSSEFLTQVSARENAETAAHIPESAYVPCVIEPNGYSIGHSCHLITITSGGGGGCNGG